MCVSACDRTVLHSLKVDSSLKSDIDRIRYVIRAKSADILEELIKGMEAQKKALEKKYKAVKEEF